MVVRVDLLLVGENDLVVEDVLAGRGPIESRSSTRPLWPVFRAHSIVSSTKPSSVIVSTGSSSGYDLSAPVGPT